MTTPEQQARDMLKRMGVDDAQSFTAGDVVELANLIADSEGRRRRGHHPDCPKYHVPGAARDRSCDFELCEMPPGAPMREEGHQPPRDGSDAELWWLRGYEAAVRQEHTNRAKQAPPLIDVLIQWYTDDRPMKREKVWAKMPQVPRPLDSIWVPLGTFTEDDGEDVQSMTVKRVGWTNGDPEHDSDGQGWHAEIWMYSAGEFPR